MLTGCVDNIDSPTSFGLCEMYSMYSIKWHLGYQEAWDLSMPSYLGTYALSLRYLRLLQMIQLVMPCLAVSAKFHPSAQIV